jgi:hypothetical protein
MPPKNPVSRRNLLHVLLDQLVHAAVTFSEPIEAITFRSHSSFAMGARAFWGPTSRACSRVHESVWTPVFSALISLLQQQVHVTLRVNKGKSAALVWQEYARQKVAPMLPN